MVGLYKAAFSASAIKGVNLTRSRFENGLLEFPFIVPTNGIHNARCLHVVFVHPARNFGLVCSTFPTDAGLIARSHHFKGLESVIVMFMTDSEPREVLFVFRSVLDPIVGEARIFLEG